MTDLDALTAELVLAGIPDTTALVLAIAGIRPDRTDWMPDWYHIGSGWVFVASVPDRDGYGFGAQSEAEDRTAWPWMNEPRHCLKYTATPVRAAALVRNGTRRIAAAANDTRADLP